MQFTVTINQVKALEWGLNSQQALLFAFVYGCPSWTKPIKTDDGIFFALSKAKIIEELPLLTDKPDTAYRMLKALEEAGLIELSSTSNITLFRLTEKAIEWNQKLDGSEKYPTPPKNEGRKKIRSTSEKIRARSEKNPSQGRKNLRQIRIPIIRVPIRIPVRTCKAARTSRPAIWCWWLIAPMRHGLRFR